MRRRPGSSSLAALLVSATLMLGACGAADPDAAAGTGAPASSDDAFPVSLEHAHGTTTIDAKPERIVTLGWMAEDVVASLGIVPVGVPTNYAGEDGYSPWFSEYVTEELDGELPEIIEVDGEGEFDLEQILALEPDLILAPHSGMTEVQYERMSEIAPTVPYAETPWLSGPWQDFTREIGTAMGESELAEERIDQTEETIAQTAAEHPELQGTDFIYGVTLWEGETEMGIYVSDDPRVQFVEQFGLVISPSLEAATEDAEDFAGGVSLENLDTLETDVFVAWEGGAGRTDATLQDPLVSRWGPIAAGTYYVMNDKGFAMATSAPTVLSIPWVLDEGFLDDLSSAVAGGAVIR
ncbi:iron-siderophore ABC transporter substrate-binding protein [Isoptericola sp. NPDC019693]|uniref:iron-siderophore ABC transporter substrate-binding protein n=1 Tax=Isoptericola sp. NPDC019693 TaxID=3364009 RepID=UPI0037B42FE0